MLRSSGGVVRTWMEPGARVPRPQRRRRTLLTRAPLCFGERRKEICCDLRRGAGRGGGIAAWALPLSVCDARPGSSSFFFLLSTTARSAFPPRPPGHRPRVPAARSHDSLRYGTQGTGHGRVVPVYTVQFLFQNFLKKNLTI